MKHAILSPSAAGRWMRCTPSARLELQFENVESEAAREGTLAHSICEALLNGYLASGVALLTLAEEKYFKREEFYTESMYEYCQDFAHYVISHFAEGDMLFVEEKLNLTRYIPEGFGHSDSSVLKIKEKHLHVFDLKFGKGVPVSAKNNVQLRIYALGVLESIDFYGYGIENVTVHIFQPRIANNSSDTFSLKDLRKWAEQELTPKAKIAFAGEGEFKAGDHCFFCNAKAQCKALADYNLELARHDFQDPALLQDADIVEILQRKQIFESWVKAVCEHALKEAIKGKAWPGYKLVEGKSNRVYTDELKIVKVLQKNLNFGYLSEIYKPQQLLGITELEKKLGKDNFNKYVVPLLHKPPGAPTLAEEGDSRPVYNRNAKDFDDGFNADEDFSDL